MNPPDFTFNSTPPRLVKLRRGLDSSGAFRGVTQKMTELRIGGGDADDDSEQLLVHELDKKLILNENAFVFSSTSSLPEKTKKSRKEMSTSILLRRLESMDIGGDAREPAADEAYSPMDISPSYQETLPECSQDDSIIDQNLAMAIQCLDINKFGAEEVHITSKEVSPSQTMETHDTHGSSNTSGLNFTFAASTAAQSQLSPPRRSQKKRTAVKIGQDANTFVPNAKVPYGLSSSEFTPYSGAPLLPTLGDFQEIPTSLYNDYNSGMQKEKETAAAQEACEKWRLRGNQAYSKGDLLKAEDCYTQGLNHFSQKETSIGCLRALMLCYSNRAATRMSLGRIRDALGDCMMAAEIDPNFLKVQVRAANCFLTLGEVQDASQHFSKCLRLASDVCVDQKIVAEASYGLQKAQKVSECQNLCSELMQRKTSADAERALEFIAEALAVSPSSEKLFEMKAEALFMMRRYREVIELCEKTFGCAEKNSPLVDTAISLDDSELLKTLYFRLWRCRLNLKSFFHLGKLEEGIASLEKEEEKVSTTYRKWGKILESSIPFVLIIRELLSHKIAGNEAFQAERHTEAVKHYSTALSCNAESRPFTAVCFYNRAAAYKELGQITDAIADCSLSIALDGSYVKAISRRATLYEMIRDYGQAAKDLNRLVSLLSKKLEETINQSGTFDHISNSMTSDLKQARLRLSEVEEEARKDMPLDMYIILGIKPCISASEIKKAYRKAALRHHPDKAVQFFARSETGDDWLWKEIAEEVHKDADRIFKMIGEAYAILSDSNKRARYDAEEHNRSAQMKKSGSSAARMPADAKNYPFERTGSSRQWRESWRSYSNSHSRGSEATWSHRYS